MKRLVGICGFFERLYARRFDHATLQVHLHAHGDGNSKAFESFGKALLVARRSRRIGSLTWTEGGIAETNGKVGSSPPCEAKFTMPKLVVTVLSGVGTTLMPVETWRAEETATKPSETA